MFVLFVSGLLFLGFPNPAEDSNKCLFECARHLETFRSQRAPASNYPKVECVKILRKTVSQRVSN